MEKLFDIKAYWEINPTNGYNEYNMWEGQLLLNENGFFEGVVVDSDGYYNEDSFIFGSFSEDKKISIYKLTPVSYSTPYIFEGEKVGDSFNGSFSFIDILFEKPFPLSIGVTQMYVRDVEATRDETEKEIEVLKYMIDRWKNKVMNEEKRKIYNVLLKECNRHSQKTNENDKHLTLQPLDTTGE